MESHGDPHIQGLAHPQSLSASGFHSLFLVQAVCFSLTHARTHARGVSQTCSVLHSGSSTLLESPFRSGSLLHTQRHALARSQQQRLSRAPARLPRALSGSRIPQTAAAAAAVAGPATKSTPLDVALSCCSRAPAQGSLPRGGQMQPGCSVAPPPLQPLLLRPRPRPPPRHPPRDRDSSHRTASGPAHVWPAGSGFSGPQVALRHPRVSPRPLRALGGRPLWGSRGP